MKRFFTAVFAIVFCVTLLPFVPAAHADAIGVASRAELNTAVSAAGADTQIVLQESFTLEEGITLPEGSNVTLQVQSPGIVLSGEGFAGAMFTVPKGSRLTLKGKEGADLTLRGTGVSVIETESPDSGILAYGTLEAEHVVFEGFSAENGAAVCLPDGEDFGSDLSALLRFCTFSGNNARKGGAVYIGSGRSAQVTACVFRENSCIEEGKGVFAAGTLLFGDNNQISGAQDYSSDENGFRFGEEISGTGSFQISRRTGVSGVVSWGGKGEVPLSVEVVLLADGEEADRQTVTPGTDEFWSFSFPDLPAERGGAAIAYDIAETPVDGYRFKKSGEADVGFEILYAEIAEPDASAETPAEPSADPNEPVFEGTSIMPPAPADAPVVTKSPTDETAESGGKVIFIAKAEHADSVVWHLISPDGTVDYTGEEALEFFTDLEIEGIREEKLKIEHIPASLGGWKVMAEFIGKGGSSFSDAAVIHVGSGAEPSPTPATEPPAPSPEPTEEPLPVTSGPVTLKKSPTGETVDLNGKAIFIAQADNAARIIWHLANPDGTLDLTNEQILSAFPALDVEGIGTEKLKLSKIPLALHGWKARAEFLGEGGPVFSNEAEITIRNYDSLLEEAEELAASAGQDPASVTEVTLPAPTATPVPEPVKIPAVEVTPIPVEIPEFTAPPAAAAQTPEIKALHVVAVWNDNSNAAGVRPVNTIVELYRNDTLYLTTALNSAGNWSYTFNNLAAGNYQVKEVSPENYTVSYSMNGNTVTIMHTYSAPVSTSNASASQYLSYTPAPANNPMPSYTPAPASPTPVPSSTPSPAVTSTPLPTLPPVTTAPPATGAPVSDTDPFADSERGINLALWVGILGAAGLLCAGVAFFLMRKPRKHR